MWLMIMENDGLFWIRQWTSGLHKNLQTLELLASLWRQHSFENITNIFPLKDFADYFDILASQDFVYIIR